MANGTQNHFSLPAPFACFSGESCLRTRARSPSKASAIAHSDARLRSAAARRDASDAAVTSSPRATAAACSARSAATLRARRSVGERWPAAAAEAAARCLERRPLFDVDELGERRRRLAVARLERRRVLRAQLGQPLLRTPPPPPRRRRRRRAAHLVGDLAAAAAAAVPPRRVVVAAVAAARRLLEREQRRLLLLGAARRLRPPERAVVDLAAEAVQPALPRRSERAPRSGSEPSGGRRPWPPCSRRAVMYGAGRRRRCCRRTRGGARPGARRRASRRRRCRRSWSQISLSVKLLRVASRRRARRMRLGARRAQQTLLHPFALPFFSRRSHSQLVSACPMR